MFVVVYGNAVDGVTIYGPFADNEFEGVCEFLAGWADDTWTTAPLEELEYA